MAFIPRVFVKDNHRASKPDQMLCEKCSSKIFDQGKLKAGIFSGKAGQELGFATSTLSGIPPAAAVFAVSGDVICTGILELEELGRGDFCSVCARMGDVPASGHWGCFQSNSAWNADF